MELSLTMVMSSIRATRLRWIVVCLKICCNVIFVSSSSQPSSSIPPSTKYMMIGVSGGLQDGFPERSKMDYQYHDPINNTTFMIPAIYIGKSLIRGYKAFLDVMEPGYRQYVDEPDQPLINSNVFASGCYEHANEYWFYFIDERQVIHVLNNEPRFLSITPDTGLIDLHMIYETINTTDTTTTNSLLPPNLIAQYETVNTFIQHYINQLRVTLPSSIIDDRYVAVPLVTAVYFNPSSHVISPPIYTLLDHTEITNYPDSLALWANVNNNDRTVLYDAGCTIIPVATTCTNKVKQQAIQAEQTFWNGIRIAIRQAEQQRTAVVANNNNTNVSSGIPLFHCKKKTRFGAGPNTLRINTPFTIEQITNLLSNMNSTIDITTKSVIGVSTAESSISSKTQQPIDTVKSEL